MSSDAPAQEQDPSLAAMVTALADGHPAGDLEAGILRLKLINTALARKLSWNTIAAALAYPSGRQLKRDTRRLAADVTRQLRLAQNRNG